MLEESLPLQRTERPHAVRHVLLTTHRPYGAIADLLYNLGGKNNITLELYTVKLKFIQIASTFLTLSQFIRYGLENVKYDKNSAKLSEQIHLDHVS